MSSDVHQAPATELNPDGIYQQIVLGAAGACAHWAHVTVTAALDVELRPRDRGPAAAQRPAHRVTQRVVQLGMWKVTLCPAGRLPAGVDPRTQDAALKAEIAHNAAETMPLSAIDQVVQVGLFGEVLYR